ncbi:hypothetical protein [Roseicyclus persicicus]|uniref:hypothetical protein n=1 Tax=Roseicyclus persicicus TaxID=2650661 RepID=UPI001B347797|nr:hypothetical protein [Roseibacterium persicicum]
MLHLRHQPPGTLGEEGEGLTARIGPRRGRGQKETAEKGRQTCFQTAHETSEQAKLSPVNCAV